MLSWADGDPKERAYGFLPFAVTWKTNLKTLGENIMMPGFFTWINSLVMDLVDLRNGNLVWNYTDLKIEAPKGLVFSRLYNSLTSDYSNGLGFGWDHSYNYILDVPPLFYRLHLPNGNTIYYQIEDDGSLTIPEGAPPLNISSSKIEVVTDDGDTVVFDRDGNSKSVTSKTGDIVNFDAENGKITKIYNDTGYFELTYDDKDLLTTVTDSAGRSKRMLLF